MKYTANFKIDFNKLPHRGKFLDWNNMIGMKVYFQNNNEIDYFTIKHIEAINNNRSRLRIHTNYHGFDSYISQGCFLNSNLSVITGKMVFGYKYNLGDVIDNRIEIIDRKRVKQGVNTYRRYKYRCKICGNIDWAIESVLVSKKIICNVCTGRKVLIGFNDIPTTAPWMVKYFQGGYDEAKLYTRSCSKRLLFKCPDCGRIKSNLMSINQLDQRRNIGCACGDGISYPNKFMYSLLEQTGLSFINEYAPDWIKPKRYDFYIPDKELIVEMDGGLGHGKSVFKKSKVSLEDTMNRDKEKDLRAIKHGLRVIRIDIEASEYDFLKDKIIEKDIFSKEELNRVNFEDCDKFACGNLVKYVSEKYEKLKPINSHELANELKMPQSTIHGYLIKGASLSMCSYDGKKYANELKKYHTKKIVCFDKDYNVVKIYDSRKNIEKELNIFGSSISACCSGKLKSAGGYLWKRYDDVKDFLYDKERLIKYFNLFQKGQVA